MTPYVWTCQACGFALGTTVDVVSDLGMPMMCPHCDAIGTMCTSSAAGAPCTELSPEDAVAAMLGHGLPSERAPTVDAISGALLGARVCSVATRTVNGRVCVSELRMDNGTTLYLCVGTAGVVAYRLKCVEAT